LNKDWLVNIVIVMIIFYNSLLDSSILLI